MTATKPDKTDPTATPNRDANQLARRSEPSAEVLKWLTTMHEVENVDPEAAALAMVDRILHATSVEETFVNREATHARDLIGVAIVVQGFDLQQSEMAESGPPVYAVIDCTRPDSGERLVVTCGGTTVLAQLYQWGKLDAYPICVRFGTTRQPTKAGFYPLWLEPAPDAEPF